MASTENTGKFEPESGHTDSNNSPPNYFRVDFVLRLVLLAASVSALVVLATSKESKIVAVFPAPIGAVTRDAKFNYSPALVYLFVALSVTCLYTVITILRRSCVLISKTAPSPKILFKLIVLDTLMVGIMASATGAGGAVAYLALKGNSHTNWGKFCGVYGKFCRFGGSSVVLSLFASIILVVLVVLSAFSLSHRIHH